jgi:hypothetical protein
MGRVIAYGNRVAGNWTRKDAKRRLFGFSSTRNLSAAMKKNLDRHSRIIENIHVGQIVVIKSRSETRCWSPYSAEDEHSEDWIIDCADVEATLS